MCDTDTILRVSSLLFFQASGLSESSPVYCSQYCTWPGGTPLLVVSSPQRHKLRSSNLDYLPFGELNSSDTNITTHKFTGDERDSETGLDHTLFRQYSSNTGNWLSPDPAGLAAVDPSNPQSWNRYVYALNDSLNLID